ncbi:class I SAM-dependent methyltransferase [Mesoterricola sediminis]|uniref:Methyltransferase n=1 Tax=Mesoterricola sediminis TaxID=2927980 RepID=A0AA48H4A6_9BACT|nr:class I SAM-dependent methyltransferase [Mesoterricola sediminis]BDU77191.1 methyltransferase [Mesoterricola sediminis]
MQWFERDFDHPLYFEIYKDKDAEAAVEGPGLAALLALPPGSRVLDLPCGWGRLRPALEAQGYEVVGGDLSPLNLARHAAEHPGALARLDLRALPFRSGCADGVFCAYTSWGYFPTDAENQRQLAEFARVLRPGGVLLLDLAGRGFFLRALATLDGDWYEVEGQYRERVRLSQDGRRFLTDRIMGDQRFQHDIWIPTDAEARAALAAAGLEVEEAFGSWQGAPWNPWAERWIYRAVKQ